MKIAIAHFAEVFAKKAEIDLCDILEMDFSGALIDLKGLIGTSMLNQFAKGETSNHTAEVQIFNGVFDTCKSVEGVLRVSFQSTLHAKVPEIMIIKTPRPTQG